MNTESDNAESIRLLNESFKVLEQRFQKLAALQRLANRAQNRDHATIAAIGDVLASFVLWTAGNPTEQTQTAIGHHAARHLDDMLRQVGSQNAQAAEAQDDRDADEIPLAPAELRGPDASKLTPGKIREVESRQKAVIDFIADTFANYAGQTPDAIRQEIELRTAKHLTDPTPSADANPCDGRN
jgi:hypothetical protein